MFPDEKIEMYSHGFFPDVSSNVMVELWKPELGGCCVTIVLDKLLTETIFADLTNLTGHRYFDLANVPQPRCMVRAGVSFRMARQ